MVKPSLLEVNERVSVICIGFKVAEVVNRNGSIMFEGFTRIRIKANGVWINAVISDRGSHHSRSLRRVPSLLYARYDSSKLP